ncbi:MAG: TIGR01244 family sulfur transferase [Pseudomonadota bacterium]
MDIRTLTDEISVSPQIDAEHMKEIAGSGFRSVLCNRPDGEELGQPDCSEIEAAAIAEGLVFRSVPMSGHMLPPELLSDFSAALNELPKPILAYCRSGTRCTFLWAVSQHGLMDSNDIVQRAARAGYDVAGLVQQLDSR